MKSLVESIISSMIPEGILDSDFDQSYDRAYEKLLKDLTELRDDLVKFIGTWQKLDKDGDGYSTDDWAFYDEDWWNLRTHIYQEFNRLIKKHHLDDVLVTWGDHTRYSDSLKIINKKGTRTTHISMIWIEYNNGSDPDDASYASVWIEDPKRFLEMLQK